MIDLFHLLLQSNKASSFVFVRFIIENLQELLEHMKNIQMELYLEYNALNGKVEIGQQIRFAIEKVLIGLETECGNGK